MRGWCPCIVAAQAGRCCSRAQLQRPALKSKVSSPHRGDPAAVACFFLTQRDGTPVMYTTYVPRWGRLSDALAQVMAATGMPPEQARIDICRAFADRAINFQAQLKRQTNGPMTSTRIFERAAFEVPRRIEPGDFDWEQSLPLRPWRLNRPHLNHGLWELAWIELTVADIIKVFGAPQKRGKAARSTKRAATRGQPAFDRAKRAIGELWPGGPPDQAGLPNKQLEGRVEDKLKELGLLSVSPDTIRRAAGRRK